MGYATKEQKAEDAFIILNELMGELHAARMTAYLASDKFLNSPKVTGLKESMTNTTRVYMRRLALSSIASVMYKFTETYDDFLKPLGCATNKARALRNKIPSHKLDTLRHVCQHILDKETNRHHEIKKIDGIFDELNNSYPDLFEQDASTLIGRLEKIRTEVEKKYPNSSQAVAKRNAV